MLKNEVGRKTNQIRTKKLLAQIMPDKIFGTKWRNTVKLDRKRKVWYLFLRVSIAIAKGYFLKGRLSIRLCVHPKLRFF